MAAVRSFWLSNKQESKSRFFKSCIFQQMWREHTLPQTLGESQSTNLKTVGTQFDSCILTCVIDSWEALWSGCSRFHLVETPPTLNIVYFPRFGKHNHPAEAFVLCCKVSVKQFVKSPIWRRSTVYGCFVWSLPKNTWDVLEGKLNYWSIVTSNINVQ